MTRSTGSTLGTPAAAWRWQRWRRVALVLGVAGLAAALTGCASPPSLPPEAGLHQRLQPRPDVVLHTVWLDLGSAGGQLRLSAPQERGRVPEAFADAARARVVVNASFFDRSYVPRGHTVSEGLRWPAVLVPESSPLLACDRAQRCRIEFEPGAEPPADGHTVVAGTPWLVRAGVARTAQDDQRCLALCARTHPRTAVGLDAAGRRLLIVLAEGRREGVPGVTLAELAGWMRSHGAHDAINLDGGGSSLLLLEGRSVMARPANEPAPRAVANVLMWIERAEP